MKKIYNEEEVFTPQDISNIVGATIGSVKSAGVRHRPEMKEGRDYIMLTSSELGKISGKKVKGNPSLPAVVYTKTGVKTLLTKLRNCKTNTERFEAYCENPVKAIPTEVVRTEVVDVHKDRDIYAAQLEFMQREAEKNEDFRNTMMTSFQMLSQVIVNQSKIISKFVSAAPGRKTDFAIWKDGLLDMIGNRDVNGVLAAAYKYATKAYGVVWDQLHKDYSRANGGRAYSNLEVAYWMEKNVPNHQNLMVACVENVLKEG